MGKIDNPPAFPRTGQGFGNPNYDEAGMTLRDWFAGQALPEAMRWAFNNANDDFLPEEWASKIAFATADAMLAEREGGAS